MSKTTFDETFRFFNAAELRDWLYQFKKTDLATVYISHGEADNLALIYQTRKLTDGSEVSDITVI